MKSCFSRLLSQRYCLLVLFFLPVFFPVPLQAFLQAFLPGSGYAVVSHSMHAPLPPYREYIVPTASDGVGTTPLFAGILAAGEYDSYVKERVLAGIDAFYSMRYDQAMVIYDDLIQKYPDEPVGYFFRSQIFLWRYLFDYSEPDYRKFIAACDKAIAVADAALLENPDNNKARTILGAIFTTVHIFTKKVL